MLRPLFEGTEHLIFNGDTVETCSKSLYEKACVMLHDLEGHLAQGGHATTILRGNHDPDLPGEPWQYLENGEVMVTHGDICFRFGSPWSPWVPGIQHKLEALEAARGGLDQVTTLQGRAELARDYAMAFHPRARYFKGKLGKLETLYHAAWPPRTSLTILKIWLNGPDMVAEWLETFAPEVKVLVMGHTHRAGLWFKRGRWIVNTGAFHPFGNPQLVDYAPGKLILRAIRARRAAFHPGACTAVLEKHEGSGQWRKGSAP